MHIDEIELFHVAMPMKAPWRTAFGEEHAIESIIVRITSDGVEGWGETAPYRLPQYSPEWASATFQLMRDILGQKLIGVDVESGERLQRILSDFKGNYFAKAGLDNAWWDAFSCQCNEPLWRLIGGNGPTVLVGADISVQERTEDLVAAIGHAEEAGYRRVKLKFRPESGVQMIKAVRDAFPNIVFHIDCNSAFTRADLPLFQALDRFGLAMIEQPLAHDDLIDHAWLQSKITTPICLDESIVSVDRVRKAIDVAACGWVNIKPGRVGGLTNALAIYRHCVERGIPCWIGGMLESAIGQGPAMALATLPGIDYPCDIFPSDRLYERDLAEPQISLDGGSQIRAPDSPGHGFRPDFERLSAVTVEHARVTHGG